MFCLFIFREEEAVYWFGPDWVLENVGTWGIFLGVWLVCSGLLNIESNFEAFEGSLDQWSSHDFWSPDAFWSGSISYCWCLCHFWAEFPKILSVFLGVCFSITGALFDDRLVLHDPVFELSSCFIIPLF
jgi:hypothetical protein